ncbi:hypothetical protein [Streptomyces sp. CBMA152]|uniref:hypothetical protein n=1 Tax=Streptomyces sp. CBMA152 TaxID=1896312 RepID=UPI001660339E|nr:hypothetical protein [Streptomyces sp. CBMA152]MBD0742011.1 hypothetical protein [Streptomyces sp. CBMA152]
MTVRRQRRGGAGFAGAVVAGVMAAGMLVTGCGEGGSGGAGGSDGRTADPGQVVAGAVDGLVAAHSSKASTSMEMASGGTRVTIRGEGVYDFTHRMGQLKVVLPKDAAGAEEHLPITELLAPGALYMKNRGAGVPADKWVRVDTATLPDGNLVTGGVTDPMVAAELLRGAGGVTYAGEENLAGVRVRHYRGVADIPRAASAAGPHARDSLAAAAKGFGRQKGAVPFDAYFDAQGLLRKLRQQFSYVNQGRTVAVASTTLLYGFGVPAAVRLPADRDIYAGKIES